MLLLLAVVQNEDAPNLAARLVDQQLRLTQISASGGLFGAGYVALLLGIEDDRYDDVLEAIHATCKTRTRYISPWPAPDPAHVYFTPVEAEVGGAVVFGVPVERFVHISGQTESEDVAPGRWIEEPITAPQVEAPTERQTARKRNAMKLMVAIVQSEDADNVVAALLEAGHRLTRINTVGGFLRRGNATLLIGVQAHQVDEIIALIQAACRPRSEAAPLEKGIPEYAANVFVLDASSFVRI